jgi:hypothetical protein
VLRQIEALPRPRSLARQAASKGWHGTHLMSPKLITGMAMWLTRPLARVGAGMRHRARTGH